MERRVGCRDGDDGVVGISGYGEESGEGDFR